MTDSAEQYLRLQTTARLLKWSIEKFRETKQGPMLSKASAISEEMTMKSFSRLLVDSEGDVPRLFGIRPSGEQVDVSGMSEGSRDQLYLALRLAALELQVEQGLGLPLIADDLNSMQIIFITRHDHLLPLARKALESDLNVVHL